MNFNLTILGSSSATPTKKRNHTAQFLQINNVRMLIDCGEATQHQLKRYYKQTKFYKLDHIFISHLHGDHYLGLMGLLSSISLFKRKRKLHIYGPANLKHIIDIHIKYSDMHMEFEIDFHPTNPHEPEVILDSKYFTVTTVPLMHRIECTGFVFQEKERRRKLNVVKCVEQGIPQEAYELLTMCENYTLEDGTIINYLEYTTPSTPPKSYAYISDTAYKKDIVPLIAHCNLLYHESTFMHDLLDRAIETQHTTAKQAGMIAKEAHVDKLIIGHFSSRYKELDPLLEEAKTEFENTELAMEGTTFSL